MSNCKKGGVMKNLFKRTILILLVVVLSGGIAFAGGDQKAEFQKLTDKLVAAVLKNDMAVMTSMYLDDVYSMPSYKPMQRGKKAMMESAEKEHKAGIKMKTFSLKVVDVFGNKDQVVVIGTYKLSVLMPGQTKAMPDKGKYMDVWQKQLDGSWKIKAEIWNTDVDIFAMMGNKK